MAEDFGDFGDETLLARDEYLLEVAENEALPVGESQGVFGDMDDDPEGEYEADDCPLDGDAEATFASCGWGNDEDYGG